jgi:hypothetical protein
VGILAVIPRFSISRPGIDGTSPTHGRRRVARRRVVALLAGGVAAFAPLSQLGIDAQAAPAAATTSVTEQGGGAGGLPSILCDIPSFGSAVLSEADVTTAIVCTGIENELVISATWVDTATGQTLSSDTQDITSPTTYYERQDSMTQGTPGARNFKFCMTAYAIGLPSAQMCNTLTAL